MGKADLCLCPPSQITFRIGLSTKPLNYFMIMAEFAPFCAEYWEGYDGESSLIGLTPYGFCGYEPLDTSLFDRKQLAWALDFALGCGDPIRTINKNYSSYELKHLAERWAKQISDNEINYISNGTFILAMVEAGFRFVRIKNTPNVYFNVSERTLKWLYGIYNHF